MSKFRLKWVARVLTAMFITLAASESVHAYTALQLAALLPNANPTIVGAETGCTQRLNARLPGKTRKDVNISGPYSLNNWISPLNVPSQASVTVPYGTTAVPLQLNQLMFLCSILVQNSEPAEISPRYTWDSTAKVTNATYPRERAPVVGDGASLYETNTRVNSASVTSGVGYISNSNSPVGDTFRMNRSNATRYWFTNTEPTFTYSYAAGLTSSQTVLIGFNLTTIHGYHPPSGRINQCVGNAKNLPDDYKLSTFQSCTGANVTFAITINVLPAPAALAPLLTSAAGATGSIIEPGKSYNFRPGALNTSTGSSLPYNLNFDGNAASRTWTTAAISGVPKPYVSPISQLALGGNSSNSPPPGFDVAISPTTPEGTVLCFSNSLTPTSPDTASGTVTLCYTVYIIHKPVVVGNGSDIHAGSGVCGLASNPGSVIGQGDSKGEYVVSAQGGISNFGSNGTGTSSAASIASYQPVTLCRPNLVNVATTFYSQHPTDVTLVAPSGLPYSLDNLNLTDVAQGNKGVIYINGDVTISGGTVSRKLTIFSTGTITISGNIALANSTAARNMQPSLGLIATNGINITGAAKQVDAYMFSNGTINTCSAGPCNNTLGVRGFLMAKTLSLRRQGPPN